MRTYARSKAARAAALISTWPSSAATRYRVPCEGEQPQTACRFRMYEKARQRMRCARCGSGGPHGQRSDRGRDAVVPLTRDAARLAAPSSMNRSAAARPGPIVRDRVCGVTGAVTGIDATDAPPRAGDRPFTRAGEMTRLASIARRRILNSRATTHASTTSPSDSCLPPSGTATRFVVARSVARAVLLESLRHRLGHRDDLRIALTPRPGPHHASGVDIGKVVSLTDRCFLPRAVVAVPRSRRSPRWPRRSRWPPT